MIITRTLLALGLAALLSVAGSGSSPASAQTDCLDGRALGQWNLPSRIERGVVRGLLVQETRDGRKFALDARLAPIRGTDGGKLDGNLYVIAPGPALRPFAQVRGTYGVGQDGSGRFDAAIVQMNQKLIPVEIGKVVGTFSDHPDTPQAESGSPGRFRGQWTLCR